MYTIPKWLAQNILDKAKTLNSTTYKVIVVEDNKAYKAKWTAHGVDVLNEYPKADLDYFRKVEALRPNITIKLLLNAWIVLYLVIWSTPDRLEYLRKAYLLDYTPSDELVTEVD